MGSRARQRCPSGQILKRQGILQSPSPGFRMVFANILEQSMDRMEEHEAADVLALCKQAPLHGALRSGSVSSGGLRAQPGIFLH